MAACNLELAIKQLTEKLADKALGLTEAQRKNIINRLIKPAFTKVDTLKLANKQSTATNKSKNEDAKGILDRIKLFQLYNLEALSQEDKLDIPNAVLNRLVKTIKFIEKYKDLLDGTVKTSEDGKAFTEYIASEIHRYKAVIITKLQQFEREKQFYEAVMKDPVSKATVQSYFEKRLELAAIKLDLQAVPKQKVSRTRKTKKYTDTQFSTYLASLKRLKDAAEKAITDPATLPKLIEIYKKQLEDINKFLGYEETKQKQVFIANKMSAYTEDYDFIIKREKAVARKEELAIEVSELKQEMDYFKNVNSDKSHIGHKLLEKLKNTNSFAFEHMTFKSKTNGSVLNLLDDTKISLSKTVFTEHVFKNAETQKYMSSSLLAQIPSLENGTNPELVKKLKLVNDWMSSKEKEGYLYRTQSLLQDYVGSNKDLVTYSIEAVSDTDKTLVIKAKIDDKEAITYKDRDMVLDQIGKLKTTITEGISRKNLIAWLDNTKVWTKDKTVDTVVENMANFYTDKAEAKKLLKQLVETRRLINPLVVFATNINTKDGTFQLPNEIKTAVQLESIAVMSRLLSPLYLSEGDMDEYIRDTFGVETSDEGFQELKNMIQTDEMIPTKLAVTIAGKNIMQSLGIKFSQDLDTTIVPSIESALGQLALERMKLNPIFRPEPKAPARTNAKAPPKTPADIAAENKIADAEMKLASIFEHTKHVETKYVDGEKVISITDTPTENGKTYNVISLKNIPKDMRKKLIRAADMVEFLKESRDTGTVSFEQKPDLVYGEATIRNTVGDLMPSSSVDYLNKEQAVSYHFSSGFVKLHELWRLEAEERKLSINDIAYEYMTVSDTDITDNVQATEQIAAKAVQQAERLDIDRALETYAYTGDESFFLSWDFTKSHRSMVDEKMLNFQNSKGIARFMTQSDKHSHTMKAVDGKYDEIAINLAHLALAQAYDLDPDKKLDATVIGEVQKDYVKINNDGTLTYATKNEKGETVLTDKAKLLKSQVEAYIDNKQFKLTGSPKHRMHIMQGIILLANFTEAVKIDDKGNVTRQEEVVNELSIEIDAITSGMMQLLLQMGTDEAMAFLEKGGIYVRNKDGKIKYETGHSGFKATTNFEKGEGLDFYETPAYTMWKSLKATAKSKTLSFILNKANSETVPEKRRAKKLELIKEFLIKPDQANPIIQIELTEDKIKEIADIMEEPNFDIRVEALKKALGDEFDKIPETYNKIEKLVQKYMIKDNSKKWRSLLKYPVMYFLYGSSLNNIKKLAGYDIGVKAIVNMLQEHGDMPVHEAYKLAFPDDTGGKGNNFTEIAQTFRELFLVLNDAAGGKILKHADNNGKEYWKTSYEQFEQLMLEFRYVNQNSFSLVGINEYAEVHERNYGNITFSEIVLTEKTQKKIAEATVKVYGDVLEKTFNKDFGFISKFRESLKSVEVLNYAIFKFKFTKAMDKYKQPDGTYHINSKDYNGIMSKLIKDGFGYTSTAANGENMNLFKTDKETVGYVGVNGASNNGLNVGITKMSSVENKTPTTNIGASGVIIIHSLDGHLQTLANANGFMNIFDAWVLNTNPDDVHEVAHTINKATIDTARSFNILENAMVKVDTALASLEKEELISEFQLFMQNDTESELLFSGFKRINKAITAKSEQQQVADEIEDLTNNMKKQRTNNLQQNVTVGHYYITDNKEAMYEETSGTAKVSTLSLPFARIKPILQFIQSKILSEQDKDARANNGRLTAYFREILNTAKDENTKSAIITILRDKGCIV